MRYFFNKIFFVKIREVSELQIFRTSNFFAISISWVKTNLYFYYGTVKEPSSETLLRLAELVLTLNCFPYATSYYIIDKSMVWPWVPKMGPSYANLFVGYIEHQFFNQYNGPKPELYRRYIDDCVGATSSTREELNQLITAVN